MLSTPLYLGVDIGKTSHAVAFLSEALLGASKQHYEKCPLKKIGNSRAEFERLLALIRTYTEPKQCHVLLEKTGHYGAALEQFLREHGISLYRIRAQGRYGDNKTDELDARALAVRLYTQAHLHAPVVNERDRVSRLIPPTPTAIMLRGLVRHHYALTRNATRNKNKLRALMDEQFPEFMEVIRDPNCPSALALRSAFPTTQDVACADSAELCKARLYTFPSNDALLRLKELARFTIGTKDDDRLRSLIIEQRQLIDELKVISVNLKELKTEITSIVMESREGRILASFIGCSPVEAATLLAGIGSIESFPNVGTLRKYMGWAPRRSQTGTTFDVEKLGKGGNRLLKRTISLIVASAVRYDPTWRTLYKRLEQRLCAFDARTKTWKGRGKVIGHVAGQLIKVMYLLLKQDARLVKQHKAGEKLPEPQLYDPGKHLVLGLQVEHAGGAATHQLTPTRRR